jgi:hypothetical protein
MNKFNKLALACAALVWAMNAKEAIDRRRNTKTINKFWDTHNGMITALGSLPNSPLQEELKHWTIVDPTE